MVHCNQLGGDQGQFRAAFNVVDLALAAVQVLRRQRQGVALETSYHPGQFGNFAITRQPPPQFQPLTGDTARLPEFQAEVMRVFGDLVDFLGQFLPPFSCRTFSARFGGLA